MLDEILAYLNNYFEDAANAVKGTIKAENGTVSLPFPAAVKWVYIRGSRFNDGLHRYPLSALTDEEFTGTVSPAMIPRAILDIAQEIEDWREKNPVGGAFQSESFGGYSYTRATVGGTIADWSTVFGKRLRRWRKL